MINWVKYLLQIFGLSTLTITIWLFIIILIISFHMILNQKIIHILVSITLDKAILTFSHHFLWIFIFTPWSFLWDVFIFYSSDITRVDFLLLFFFHQFEVLFFGKTFQTSSTVALVSFGSTNSFTMFPYYFMT